MNMMVNPPPGLGPILTEESLRSIVPSVFATRPWERMSSRYRFVPTIDVVRKMQDTGFYPVHAMQSRTRIEGKAGFVKHIIRFRSTALERVGQEIPEVIILNSHDGSSQYRIGLGIFSVVCLNGLVVAKSSLSNLMVRHSGNDEVLTQIGAATDKIVNDVPRIMATIDGWQKQYISGSTQLAYATEAYKFRTSTLTYDPEQLLVARRSSEHPNIDGERSLWTTYNVVQENMIKGGLYGRNARDNPRRVRAIKTVDADLATNEKLWALAQSYTPRALEIAA